MYCSFLKKFKKFTYAKSSTSMNNILMCTLKLRLTVRKSKSKDYNWKTFLIFNRKICFLIHNKSCRLWLFSFDILFTIQRKKSVNYMAAKHRSCLTVSASNNNSCLCYFGFTQLVAKISKIIQEQSPTPPPLIWGFIVVCCYTSIIPHIAILSM